MSGGIVSGGREISHHELMARVARAAAGLAGLGIGENDAVALLLRNDFSFLEASMAAPAVGAYAVPINWHFTAHEAGYILADCAAKALVVHADLLPGIATAIPDGVHVFVVPTPPEVRAAYALAGQAAGSPGRARLWDEFVEAQSPWTAAPIGARDSMIYTSGTTGRPKGVRRRSGSQGFYPFRRQEW